MVAVIVIGLKKPLQFRLNIFATGALVQENVGIRFRLHDSQRKTTKALVSRA